MAGGLSAPGVQVDAAMLETRDGHGRHELVKSQAPTGQGTVVAGLRAHGAELVGEVGRYEDTHRLCTVRDPDRSLAASS